MPATNLAAVFVETQTDAVLKDGATINIRVRVGFKTTAQPEAVVRAAVSDWFRESGDAQYLTLSKFVNDINQGMRLSDKLKGLSDATAVSLLGLSVVTPPISAFEDKSKQVTAILKSGETVRLTFAAPPGMPDAPGAHEMARAYELLASLSLPQLAGLPILLNDKLLPPDNGWSYLVLGLEQLGCPCQGA